MLNSIIKDLKVNILDGKQMLIIIAMPGDIDGHIELCAGGCLLILRTCQSCRGGCGEAIMTKILATMTF